MSTERLYYNDCYRAEFPAHVVDQSEDGRLIYLDHTAFYPTSGGQPFDTGYLIVEGTQVPVLEVVDEDDRIAHRLDRPLNRNDLHAELTGQIEWPRRFDHMQQHSGQHLLSAVIQKLFDVPTVSFHMGADASTIELAAAVFTAKQIEQTELLCAEIVADSRPITISYEDDAHNKDLGLRKPSQRTGTLRLISIEGIDLSACGGTHLRRTSEIGPIFIRKQEKLRGNIRLEFVCGARALRHAKSDFATLQELSRLFSVPAAQTPALAAAQLDRVKSLEKSAQKLTVELARLQGGELWAATAANPAGLKVITRHALIDDALRSLAQAFVAQGKAAFIAVSSTAPGEPSAVLFATSADSGLHAGNRIKAAAANVLVDGKPARGGGNATLAQASLLPGADIDTFLSRLLQ